MEQSPPDRHYYWTNPLGKQQGYMANYSTYIYMNSMHNTLFNFWRQNSVYKAPRFSIESQGFTEDQDKEKDKDSQDH